MKKFYFVVVGVAAASLALNGCVSISKYTPTSAEEEKPILKGGIGKEEPKIKIDIELLEVPDLSKFSAPKTPDNEVMGNRGNLEGGVLMLHKNYEGPSETSELKPMDWWPKEPQLELPLEAVSTSPIIEKGKTGLKKINLVTKYKVKKGQTLQEISKEIYGTTKKWKKIYEANKDKLKSPDKIYAGQILNIPQKESVKHLK